MLLASNTICHDFITADWTQKDWAVNLFPLGGIASVVYEIGCACLCSSGQRANIADGFAPSRIQIIITKGAQCLWVPILILGVLKLASMVIANRRQSSCRVVPSAPQESPQFLNATHQETCLASVPQESPKFVNATQQEFCLGDSPQLLLILAYLNLHELGASSCVNKTWHRRLKRASHLWKAAIYALSFSSKDWARLDGRLVQDVDFKEEMLSFPNDIVEQLRLSCKAFPAGSLIKTHVLIRMPKGLSINILGQLAKKEWPDNEDGYRYFCPILYNAHFCRGDDFVNRTVDKSVWLLMTKGAIDGTKNKIYREQKTMVSAFARKSLVPYEIPTTLEAATCLLGAYWKFNIRLLNVQDPFSNQPRPYIRCKEDFLREGYRVHVGAFLYNGFAIYTRKFYEGDPDIGVAAIRRF